MFANALRGPFPGWKVDLAAEGFGSWLVPMKRKSSDLGRKLIMPICSTPPCPAPRYLGRPDACLARPGRLRAATIVLAVGLIATSNLSLAKGDIRFDLPSVVEATDGGSIETAGGDRMVKIPLRLSLMVGSSDDPKIDQLWVEVHPLGGEALVVDYSPRTEMASEFSSDIEVVNTDENNEHIGFSLDAAYGHLARGNVGADRGEKNIASQKYQRVAPMQVVAASGTTRRGRGVYFKLRATPRQVLEGDKAFEVTLKVPPQWRGELIEVSVDAQGTPPRSRGLSFTDSLASWAGTPGGSQSVATGRFLVAASATGDSDAMALATDLAHCEWHLRTGASAYLRGESSSGLSSLRRYVTYRPSSLAGPVSTSTRHERISHCLQKSFFGKLDVLQDPHFRELPYDVRGAFLDYLEAKHRYLDYTTYGVTKGAIAKGPERATGGEK